MTSVPTRLSSGAHNKVALCSATVVRADGGPAFLKTVSSTSIVKVATSLIATVLVPVRATLKEK